MSVNSSSPSNSSLGSSVYDCFNSTVSILISTAFNITRTILTLPLSIFILYLGHRRWRQQQQRSVATISHSDVITYNMAAMDLMWSLGSAFFFCGSSTDLPEMVITGYWICAFSLYGETFLHLLTCVERYLAVVRPVTYLGLRKARGARIRNVSIGCVWLLSFVWAGVILVYNPISVAVPFFCPLVISLAVVSFCSLSVLRVLIRPGPGDGVQDKERVDQSKQRAFITITAIMGVLLLWFGGVLVAVALDASPLLSPSVGCVVRSSAFWFSLPSSLVLPLLYLHRAGKLSCCCLNSE